MCMLNGTQARMFYLYRLLLLSTLSVLFVCETAQAQKINRSQPSVYLTFKEFVKRTASEAHPSEGARLVLHNNTRWPVYYGEWLESTLPGDAALIYNIEMAEDGCFVPRRHIDVVTKGKLMPGRSVSFTVPREDFPKGSLISVMFNFSWELVREERLPKEARHRTYFNSSDLPDWPLK
jgi:hypothetical protein